MDNLRAGGKGKEKIRGIYVGVDREGRIPLVCNCGSCKKQRKRWGEKPVAVMECVPVREKMREFAGNNINLILASGLNENLVTEAHRNNIQVYPIINFTSDNAKNLSPDWYMTNAAGEKVPYGDPGNPGYREFLIRPAVELVKKYDIDGISLDFSRYIEMEISGDCCYCAACRKKFRLKYDFDPIVLAVPGKKTPPRELSQQAGQYLWNKERKDNITTLVSELKKAICGVKKGIKLSSYVWGAEPVSRLVFQDWSQWIEDKSLDWVNPSGYDYDLDSFQRRCVELAAIVNKRCPSCITLGQHTTHGRVKNAAELIRQIKIADKAGLVDGFVLFTHSLKTLSSYLPSIKRVKI
ncbi:MAG: family 10 glycosylhydrolase [Candidatus Omnitrophica bacterium]|nr:family 10 glycosylhydrolase [Candidatus Omnitrophota bacterium]